MSFKNKSLTESDLKIIENHSKKNMSDSINEIDNTLASCPLNEQVGKNAGKLFEKN